VTALPAVDGLGDPQVSFLVEFENIKLMHFGDTLWHGHWWKIRARCGPPDVAFLPINGAITQFPNMKPSAIPADLMPAQAASAAAILEAGVACPIHYGAFHNPPVYVELPDVERMFLKQPTGLELSRKLSIREMKLQLAEKVLESRLNHLSRRPLAP
jgi:L-ascorbate metabolism protein UlaG (beta-lactamase superfamily)